MKNEEYSFVELIELMSDGKQKLEDAKKNN